MRIAALVMAAGQGSRFKGCKALARLNGQAMLQQVIHQVNPVVTETYVISGAWHQALELARHSGELRGATLLHHRHWAKGLGSSIAFGISQLEPCFDAVLIVLADQVALTRHQLSKLVAAFDGRNIPCARYAGRRGVPALFGRDCFGRLKALSGDQGAKALLYDGIVPVCECPMPEAGVDIDTRQQLTLWLQRGRGPVSATRGHT